MVWCGAAVVGVADLGAGRAADVSMQCGKILGLACGFALGDSVYDFTCDYQLSRRVGQEKSVKG